MELRQISNLFVNFTKELPSLLIVAYSTMHEVKVNCNTEKPLARQTTG